MADIEIGIACLIIMHIVMFGTFLIPLAKVIILRKRGEEDGRK